MVWERGGFIGCAKVNGWGALQSVTSGEDGKYVKELSAGMRRARGSSHHRQCKGRTKFFGLAPFGTLWGSFVNNLTTIKKNNYEIICIFGKLFLPLQSNNLLTRSCYEMDSGKHV